MADIRSAGAKQLSTQEGITPQLTPNFFNTDQYNLQLQENFIIVFQNMKGLFDGFELIAQSVTPPTRSTEQIPVNYANMTINVAGRQTFGNMTIVFRDVISKDTELALTAWFEAILSLKKGTRGSIEKYKTSIEIIPMDANGEKGRPSIAYGCFPTSINWGDLSYESTGIRTLSVEFSVDYYARKEVFDGTIDQKTFNN